MYHSSKVKSIFVLNRGSMERNSGVSLGGWGPLGGGETWQLIGEEQKLPITVHLTLSTA